ncbi:DUF4198 domain-containing protein [Phenylobacterium sp. J367]|uniref:DUF4198 domain-containing protein n=1 Tax=Phenylobacterium sp. J367 TaxID=2898435 RepID=UPI002150F0AA|nr:DUF4198 domain-containing protein [Phenylobacterium sp. J367]MCR5878678.1 DUF4198 domain-containing protein [Phenylobacterium sp. J367]
MKASRAAGLLAGLAVVALPFAAQAHRQWMTPSSTVLSGQDAWVTVDAAVSNTLFHPDHVPMRLNAVQVIGPDGGAAQLENGATGKFRSTFDVHLTKPGTYKIVNATDMLSASWKEGTETKRWRGAKAELTTAVPAGAADLKVMSNQRRVETFVTLGAPNATALKPTGRGLELEPVTHPNDLVSGEAAKFKLLLDGQPASGVEVEVVPGAARYRKAPGEIKVTTGADGVFQVTWPEAGMYWVEASVRGGPGEVANSERNAAYVATFEVLPD